MKMPNNQSNEQGLYDYEDTYFADAMENNGVEEFNNSTENDFSEYLWMENEEEFDKEVMQKLEEEALMEECIEAMLADETREDCSNQSNSIPVLESSSNQLNDLVKNLKLDCSTVAKESNLNPLAEEFVPGRLNVSQQEEVTVSLD